MRQILRGDLKFSKVCLGSTSNCVTALGGWTTGSYWNILELLLHMFINSSLLSNFRWLCFFNVEILVPKMSLGQSSKSDATKSCQKILCDFFLPEGNVVPKLEYFIKINIWLQKERFVRFDVLKCQRKCFINYRVVIVVNDANLGNTRPRLIAHSSF